MTRGTAQTVSAGTLSKTGVVSIIIVNWNTKDYLSNCLESIQKIESGLSIEVIVVDNNSSDNSAKMVAGRFPEVKLIANDFNANYAKGNNQALELASGDYILFLNPDTVIPSNIFDTLADKMKADSRIGVLSCQLRNFDNSIQKFCSGLPTIADEVFLQTGFDKRYPRNKLAGHKKMSFFSCDTEAEVEQPPGTFLFVRREVIDKTGGFNEEFQLFYNDVDFCKRVIDAGWKIVFTPSVFIYHHKSAGVKKNFEYCLVEEFYARRAYYKKYYSGKLTWFLSFFAPFIIDGMDKQECGDFKHLSHKKVLVLKTSYEKHFQWLMNDLPKKFPEASFDLLATNFDDAKMFIRLGLFRNVFPYISNDGFISFLNTDNKLKSKLRSMKYDAVVFPHASVDGAGYWNIVFFSSFLSPRAIYAFGVDGVWRFFRSAGVKQIRGVISYITAYLLLICGGRFRFLHKH